MNHLRPAHAAETPPQRRVRRVLEFAVALAGLLLVAAAIGAVSISRSSASCRACHQGQDLGGTEARAHASLRCTQCHTPLLEGLSLTGVLHAVEGRFGTFRAANSTVGRVPSAACAECHPQGQLVQVTQSRGLRMSHEGLDDAGWECVDCHESLVHHVSEGKLRVPTMSTCVGCHDDASSPKSCALCHTDASADDPKRLGDAEFAVTHGPRWRETHALGDTAMCSMCHEPEKCEKCHGVPLPHSAAFGGAHGSEAIDAGIDTCIGCHTQAFCTSCHGMEMPHPEGFLPDHSSLAEGYTDPRCMVCHTTENCGQCHTQHAHPGRVDRFRAPPRRSGK